MSHPSVRWRRGQSIIETMVAAVVLTVAFLCLFRLSHTLTGKILAEYAAMRVARARTVGLNDFMCLKAARVAMIPVSGALIWPNFGSLSHEEERGRAANYLAAPNHPVANGVLQYDGWSNLSVDPGKGDRAKIRMQNEWFDVTGSAATECNFEYYMDDMGL